MEDSVKSWFEKIERQGQELRDEFIRSSTALSTKLDIYLPRQDEHDTRIRALEDEIAKFRSEAQSKHRANNLLIGVGMIAAVIVGVLLDHYVLK